MLTMVLLRPTQPTKACTLTSSMHGCRVLFPYIPLKTNQTITCIWLCDTSSSSSSGGMASGSSAIWLRLTVRKVSLAMEPSVLGSLRLGAWFAATVGMMTVQVSSGTFSVLARAPVWWGGCVNGQPWHPAQIKSSVLPSMPAPACTLHVVGERTNKDVLAHPLCELVVVGAELLELAEVAHFIRKRSQPVPIQVQQLQVDETADGGGVDRREQVVHLHARKQGRAAVFTTWKAVLAPCYDGGAVGSTGKATAGSQALLYAVHGAAHTHPLLLIPAAAAVAAADDNNGSSGVAPYPSFATYQHQPVQLLQLAQRVWDGLKPVV